MTPAAELAAQIVRDLPPGGVADITIKEQTGAATGASATMRGDDLESLVVGGEPTVALEGAGANAGALEQSASGTAWGGGDALLSLMLWGGLGLIAAGGLIAWAVPALRRLGISLLLWGGALALAAWQPGIAILVLLADRVLGLVPQVAADLTAWAERRRLKAMVLGVEAASDPKTKQAIRTQLNSQNPRDDAAMQPLIRWAETAVKPKGGK